MYRGFRILGIQGLKIVGFRCILGFFQFIVDLMVLGLLRYQGFVIEHFRTGGLGIRGFCWIFVAGGGGGGEPLPTARFRDGLCKGVRCRTRGAGADYLIESHTLDPALQIIGFLKGGGRGSWDGG